jgi:hypothetical protein
MLSLSERQRLLAACPLCVGLSTTALETLYVAAKGGCAGTRFPRIL